MENTFSVSARNLLSDGKWMTDKTVAVKNGRIVAISDGLTSDPVEYLVPGLIDNHIHGGNGFFVVECTEDGMERWLRSMAERGVLGVMLCTYGADDKIREALKVGRIVKEKQKAGEIGGAVLLGVHSEGPFLSPNRPGAMMPDTLKKPGVDAFREVFGDDADLLTEMTIAPEEDDGFALTRYLRSIGCRVLAGHTDCDCDTALAAFDAGVGATTHTFNAMRPLSHRDPGILGAVLTSPEIYCEMIGDIVHLHPATIRLLHRTKGAERLMLISDAEGTTGMPDGEYQLPHTTVYVKNGESRLADGTLDCGACFTTESVRRITAVGIPPRDALRMASATPAEWLGLRDWDVRVGCPARFSCFDSDLRLAFACIGDEIYGK